MGSAVLLFLLVGFTVTLAQYRSGSYLVSRTHYQDDAGQYVDSAQYADGQLFQETGKLKRTSDGRDHVLVKEGTYRYISPEGVPVSISYTADEYGFHPVGDVIPKAQQATSPTF